ncbi:hypothetical protein HGRIS_007373 [Hohenbuehelia grisea]|uniref:Uncharacterized protein n=1 Tax=Hohenbuehelia grisea TaxID=104357 RepID=A0ABR3J4Y8_9AGAR
MAIEAEDGDRLRIAIALSALKFKPLEQSFEAYALDLQAVFAPSSRRDGTSVSQVQVESDMDPWRQRAIDLEKDLAELQAQLDGEHIKVVELSSATATDAGSVSLSSKKKGKKKATTSDNPPERTVTPARFDLNSVLEGLAPGIATTTGSLSIFATFTEFQRLTSALRHSPWVSSDNRTLLLSVARRALDTGAAALQPLLNHTFSGPAEWAGTRIADEAEFLQTLNVLIVSLVDSVFPMFIAQSDGKDASIVISSETGTRDSETEQIMSALVGSVLLPIVHAFAPLSFSFAQRCFGEGSAGTRGSRRQQYASHIRQAFLGVFRDVFRALCRHSPPSCGFRELLALAAARELERLDSGSGAEPGKTSKAPSAFPTSGSGTAGSRSDATPSAGTGNSKSTSPLSERGNITSELPATRTVTAAAPSDSQWMSRGYATGRAARGDAAEGAAADRSGGAELGASRRGGRASWIARLARKDAMWFLCAVLHVVFDAPEAQGGQAREYASPHPRAAGSAPASQHHRSGGPRPDFDPDPGCGRDSSSGSAFGSGSTSASYSTSRSCSGAARATGPGPALDTDKQPPYTETRAQIARTLIGLLRPASGTRPTPGSAFGEARLSPWARPIATSSTSTRPCAHANAGADADAEVIEASAETDGNALAATGVSESKSAPKSRERVRYHGRAQERAGGSQDVCGSGQSRTQTRTRTEKETQSQLAADASAAGGAKGRRHGGSAGATANAKAEVDANGKDGGLGGTHAWGALQRTAAEATQGRDDAGGRAGVGGRAQGHQGVSETEGGRRGSGSLVSVPVDSRGAFFYSLFRLLLEFYWVLRPGVAIGGGGDGTACGGASGAADELGWPADKRELVAGGGPGIEIEIEIETGMGIEVETGTFTGVVEERDDERSRGTRCGSGEVDAVARGMVLAVLERFWLWSGGR